jgi:enoyl-CoA hydratase/carnithine racemase
MMKRVTRANAQFLMRALRSSSSGTPRDYVFFDNVEVKEGVAVLRLNGPAKMNTLSPGMQDEAERIFKDKLLQNKDIKAVVFISSKPDNFIAGADIDMIKNFPDKSKLKELVMKGHTLFNEFKKVRSLMIFVERYFRFNAL